MIKGFSTNSAGIFPELKGEITHFKAITKKVYRECSEYVHGNNSVIDKIPNSLEYSKDLFEEWNTKADIINRIILFTLCLRYLKILKEEERKKVTDSLIEEFNSISLDMPVATVPPLPVIPCHF